MEFSFQSFDNKNCRIKIGWVPHDCNSFYRCYGLWQALAISPGFLCLLLNCTNIPWQLLLICELQRLFFLLFLFNVFPWHLRIAQGKVNRTKDKRKVMGRNESIKSLDNLVEGRSYILMVRTFIKVGREKRLIISPWFIKQGSKKQFGILASI